MREKRRRMKVGLKKPRERREVAEERKREVDSKECDRQTQRGIHEVFW